MTDRAAIVTDRTNGSQIGTWVKPEVFEAFDRLARDLKLSRAALLRRMIEDEVKRVI